jgi:hypothetical protein
MKTGIFLSVTGLGLLLTACASPAQVPAASPSPQAQASAAPPPAASGTASSTEAGAKAFSEQEIEQLVAPIALHPDALFTQILMASTYPLEVVAADRWVKSNPGLKGKALEDALQTQTWDPSVKSLTVFPQVLAMMSDKIDWTQKLGDAFLAQQKDVLAAAQTLRRKAEAQGSLKDTEQQKVVTEQVESQTVIKIVPTNPEVVYVPTYNPTVVYGAWPYPAYPPYSYYPPGYAYAPGAALFTFAAGAAVGAALWGDCNWGHGDVNINTNRYNSFNRSNVSNRTWSHNAAHRGAVPYRDRGVAQQYGGTRTRADAAAREQFRGRADAGRGAIQRGEVSSSSLGNRGGVGDRNAGLADRNSGVGDRNSGLGDRNSGLGDRNSGPGDRNSGLGDRNSGVGGRNSGLGERSSGVGNRSAGARDTGMRSSSAFDAGRGAQTRDFSSRGSSSLSSARSSGNFGGGGFGGGGRGGGGRGGGGRGGGRGR